MDDAAPQRTEATLLTAMARVSAARHGGRAKCLQRLIRLDLPVPTTMALPFDTVRAVAQGGALDMDALLAPFGAAPLLTVRPSSQDPDWGGPGTILLVGMNDARHAELARALGAETADQLYRRFVETYAVQVARLDADDVAADDLPGALAAYADETGEPFPQDPARQLLHVLRSMARAWEGTSARLLREARGAPADAGLGLVVQATALGMGPGESGAGTVQFIDPLDGRAQVTGRYVPQSLAGVSLRDPEALYLARDARGPSLEARAPAVLEALRGYGETCRRRLREEMTVEFVVTDGRVAVLDAVRVARSARAAVRVAVRLAEDAVISREEAIGRIEPRALAELLHPQIDPRADRNRLVSGIPASPGAATGLIALSPATAQAMAARGEDAILVRRETSPEDIRGMHAARAILTERGGASSHAAVIARGLGLPCVVGAMGLDVGEATVRIEGRTLREGDAITVDGTRGEALMGRMPLLSAAPGGAMATLLGWADAVRDMGVRANADTPRDARIAHKLGAEGIGLCRTEHMVFEDDRLTIMREMIFAETDEDRRGALDRLLPLQRDDFREMFRIMDGAPVTLRLFDPPLHEFLPSSRSGLRELAEALGRPLSDVTRRAEALAEANPMLGMRGVRLGIVVPEIYEMQARAVFEATVAEGLEGRIVVPEIMIPLVSARREVEIVRAQVDGAAAAVRAETGRTFDFRLGVMVETPRAALLAGEIARHAAFLSFGTNDLTQMTYGLSRDDAGRFMSDYVRQGVWPEDPFLTLDAEGVGELLSIAAERGRAARPDIALSICGEHGGNAESIAFCRDAGFDYVSCSPFRVPLARLAAAQIAIAAGPGQVPGVGNGGSSRVGKGSPA